VRVIKLPYRAPRANSFAERWVGTARREALDHLLIFGRRHLERVLLEYVCHYEEARPHQSLAQQVPRPREALEEPMAAAIMRRDRLGGLIHESMSTSAVPPKDWIGFLNGTGLRRSWAPAEAIAMVPSRPAAGLSVIGRCTARPAPIARLGCEPPLA
jgi:hypothetical protein